MTKKQTERFEKFTKKLKLREYDRLDDQISLMLFKISFLGVCPLDYLKRKRKAIQKITGAK